MGSTPGPENLRPRKTPKSHGNERVRSGLDIGADRIIGPEEAGFGQSLDEAEEAWLEHERGDH